MEPRKREAERELKAMQAGPGWREVFRLDTLLFLEPGNAHSPVIEPNSGLNLSQRISPRYRKPGRGQPGVVQCL